LKGLPAAVWSPDQRHTRCGEKPGGSYFKLSKTKEAYKVRKNQEGLFQTFKNIRACQKPSWFIIYKKRRWSGDQTTEKKPSWFIIYKFSSEICTCYRSNRFWKKKRKLPRPGGEGSGDWHFDTRNGDSNRTGIND
jgi:hypothetical protein